MSRQPLHVVLDNLRSAFNVGSIFRTSDAGGVEHLYLCGVTAHPPHEKLAKTALGATETVPWSYHRSTARAVTEIRRRGIPVVALENLAGTLSHLEFSWPRPVGLVLGHEVEGVAPEVLGLCDHTVHIPMLGRKKSLNVATAYGIVLYEVLRQWGALS